MLMHRWCAAGMTITLVGFGVASPVVATADDAVLTMDSAFLKAMKKEKVKTTAVKPATFKASAFTFPARMEGKQVALDGGMKMKNGKKVVQVLRMVVNPATGALDAEVSVVDGKNPPMRFPIPGLMRVTGGANQLADQGTWTAATVKLAKSVTITGNTWDPAKLIGGTLGLKLKKGAKVGDLTITLTP